LDEQIRLIAISTLTKEQLVGIDGIDSSSGLGIPKKGTYGLCCVHLNYMPENSKN